MKAVGVALDTANPWSIYLVIDEASPMHSPLPRPWPKGTRATRDNRPAAVADGRTEYAHLGVNNA